MKLLKVTILAIALFCTSTCLRANSFRYDWVPTSGTTGFILPGSYLDLNATSGIGLGSASILDWKIVTPSGTLTDLNSTLGPTFLQWNSSTILTLMGGVMGGTASATFIGSSSILFGSTSGLGIAYGSWQDPPSPSPGIPEQASTSLLLLLAVAGLVATHCIWRKPIVAIARC
jgi:hypothetical protein